MGHTTYEVYTEVNTEVYTLGGGRLFDRAGGTARRFISAKDAHYDLRMRCGRSNGQFMKYLLLHTLQVIDLTRFWPDDFARLSLPDQRRR